jgi:hypothetical protein
MKMTRNLKTFGIAFAAVFAVAAVAASAAQAQTDPAHVTAGANSGYIEVTEHPNATTQLFVTDLGSVSCDGFTGTGHYEGGEGGTTTFEKLTLEEVEYYEECNLAGSEAEVNFDGCHYTLENPSWDTEAEDGKSDVTIGPESCAVVISVPITGCEVVVPGGQTFKNALTYTNVKTDQKEELTIHANVQDEIRYEYYCDANTENKLYEAENGTYEGTLTAKAFDTNDQQVDLTATPTTE